MPLQPAGNRTPGTAERRCIYALSPMSESNAHTLGGSQVPWPLGEWGELLASSFLVVSHVLIFPYPTRFALAVPFPANPAAVWH